MPRNTKGGGEIITPEYQFPKTFQPQFKSFKDVQGKEKNITNFLKKMNYHENSDKNIIYRLLNEKQQKPSELLDNKPTFDLQEQHKDGFMMAWQIQDKIGVDYRNLKDSVENLQTKTMSQTFDNSETPQMMITRSTEPWTSIINSVNMLSKVIDAKKPQTGGKKQTTSRYLKKAIKK